MATKFNEIEEAPVKGDSKAGVPAADLSIQPEDSKLARNVFADLAKDTKGMEAFGDVSFFDSAIGKSVADSSDPIVKADRSKVAERADVNSTEGTGSAEAVRVAGASPIDESTVDKRAEELAIRDAHRLNDVPAEMRDAVANFAVRQADLLAAADPKEAGVLFYQMHETMHTVNPGESSGQFSLLVGDALRGSPNANTLTIVNGVNNGETTLRDSKAVSAENPDGIIGRAFSGGMGETIESLGYDRKVYDAAMAIKLAGDATTDQVPPEKMRDFVEAEHYILKDFDAKGLLNVRPDVPVREKPVNALDLDSQERNLILAVGGEQLRSMDDPQAFLDGVINTANTVPFAKPGEQASLLASAFADLSKTNPSLDRNMIADTLAKSMNEASNSNDFYTNDGWVADSLTYFQDRRLAKLGIDSNIGAVVTRADEPGFDSQLENKALQNAIVAAAIIREQASQLTPDEQTRKNFAGRVITTQESLPR